MLSALDVASAALILGLAATLLTAVGFGIGLVAVPLLVWAGHPLPNAVAMLLGAALFQCSYGIWMSRQHLDWRHTLRVAVPATVFVPVGVLGMHALVETGPARVKQVIGALVLLLLVVRQFVRPRPRGEVPPSWGLVAGGLAGFLGGLVGMGGPPLVLYGLAHDWEKDRFRVFMWSQMLLGIPVMLAALSWRLGTEVLGAFLWGLAVTPVLWIGAKAGLALTARWEASQLQRAATVVLYAIGAASLLGPM